MTDSWSSFSDVASDQLSLSDQLLLLCNKVNSCVEKLDASDFNAALSDEITKELALVRVPLVAAESSQLYIDELVLAQEHALTHNDHRNVGVLRYCLQQLGRYISDLANNKQEQSILLVSGLNEMAAMHGRALISETLLSVPAVYQVKFDALQKFHTSDSNQKENQFSTEESYLEFSQLVLSVYRGQKRSKKLQLLSAYFERLEQYTIDKKAQAFWAACAAYTQTISVSSGELRPAIFKIFEQIEKIVMAVLASDKSPVLGIQGSVDQLLCNLLCELYCDGYQGDCLPRLEAEFELTSVLRILESHRELEPQGNGVWLRRSARALWSKLRSCTELVGAEQALDAETSISDVIAIIRSLKLLLVLSGVHSARENLQEVQLYLESPVTAETISSCVTSLQLVEQQMLYQFDFLNEGADPALVFQDAFNNEAYKANTAVEATASIPTEVESPEPVDFGAKCNLCIDVIQQALDTALGSSGNLIPDNSVISALDQLIDIVEGQGVDELAGLLSPLASFLAESENTTLNQSETLLVQEAVIAATLGIDSLVGDKVMPDLVADVTDRIETAMSSSGRAEGELNQSEFFDSFLNEAEELLPRLFELFQRWRGAPFGSSRLHSEISRLLHSFKHSAEEVNEASLASVVHYLESTMLDLRHNDVPPAQAFFDLALESVEWLIDDIDRLRNNELAGDSADLIDRLKLAGALDAVDTVLSDASVLNAPAADSAEPIESASKKVSELFVIDDESTVADTSPDSLQHLQHAGNSFKSINQNQNRIVKLQKKLTEAVNSTPENPNDGANKQQLQSLLKELSELAQAQSDAVNHLGLQLSAAAQVGLEPLRESLIKALSSTIEEVACRVNFKFESNGIKVHRELANGLQQALEPLVCSTVIGAFESIGEREEAAKPEVPTVAISFKQTKSALVVEVKDDGAGVTVHGAEARSASPWQQASKVGWEPPVMRGALKRPTAWSNLDDTPIDISAMIDLAAVHGATVAVSGNESGSQYTLTLPQLQSVHDALVVEVQQQQFAIKASQVSQVSKWSGEKAMSLAKLLGIKKKTAFGVRDAKTASLVLCDTAYGEQRLLVDSIIGHQSLEFSSADRLMPDVPGYEGAVVVGGDQVVMLLDLDYWIDIS